MNRFLLIMIFSLTGVLIATTGHTASICTIINNLKSGDPVIVENSCKRLGLVRGTLGLSKVQVLHPQLAKRSNSLLIIALSWESPRDGYLILMDSKADVLAQQRVGYIKSLTLRPLQSEGDDKVVIDVITGTGTGMREDQFLIFSITNVGFSKLWAGLSYKKSFPGQLSPESNYEVKGSLRFDDLNEDGVEEIIHTTKRKRYFYDSNLNKLIPLKSQKRTEVYELKEEKYLFLREDMDT